MRFCLILTSILCLISSAFAGSLENYSNLNLLSTNSIFGSNAQSTRVNLGKIKANSNTSIGFGIGADLNEWSLCAGKYVLNAKCMDSNFRQPITQTLIGPQINFESKSSEGGFESSASYTSSSALPLNQEQAPANVNRFKIESSVNLNLSANSQLKFIGEYKHHNIITNPQSIINDIPKDEYGVGLKLNIGF